MSGNKPKLNYYVIDGPVPICSGFNGEFLNDSSRSLVLNLCFCKESNTNIVEQVSFEVTFRVLSSSPFDLIIGRRTIKQFKLGLLLPSHFFDKETVVSILGAKHPFSPVHIMVDRLLVVRGTITAKHHSLWPPTLLL